MKAIIITEIKCGECGSLMQYHKESKVVRCNQLKCRERRIEYKAPSITLQRDNEAPLTVYGVSQVSEEFYREMQERFEIRFNELQGEMIQPLIDKLEGIIKANQQEKPKRGRPKATAN